jgi:hypothetical protein
MYQFLIFAQLVMYKYVVYILIIFSYILHAVNQHTSSVHINVHKCACTVNIKINLHSTDSWQCENKSP